ncbi:alpha/beta hydrolase family protein [Shouchella patagoniensis]|uniref:alpha/beta hydrolase family protein n=1 Tax=Shouchella patagoniensis TaxID=228576 RepID=UPI0009952346|nr:alpha/beta fold hydrolase [Shouchella patagoniensis]
MSKFIRYPSMDRLEIEALYYEPAKDKDNGYTILLPHGGPQAADLLTFSSWQQIFAFEGYRVVSPNYRGSTRYGSSFTKMVEGDWGDGPRYDVIACVEYLIDQGWVNREKLFVLGASYGGYMSLLLHGRHPDYFKAVIDICGVSNLFSFSSSVPDSWKPIMEQWVGGERTG